MNRKQKIIVSVTGIFLVLLILMGLTYAYFLTHINGNINNQSITLETGDLILDYLDGNGELTAAEAISPGNTVKFKTKDGIITETKTFSVENTGDATVNYGVIIDNFSVTYANNSTLLDGTTVAKGDITSFVFPEDFKLEINCKSELGDCDGFSGTLPTLNTKLLTNDIEVGEIQEYELKLTYEDSGIDQSADMNKTFAGRIDIIDTVNTIDIEGTVVNYTPGDYIETNSVKRTSIINADGNYRILGLEPETHTLKVMSKDGAAKTTHTLNISKGEKSSINGTEIVSTDNERTFGVDVVSDGIYVLPKNDLQGVTVSVLKATSETENQVNGLILYENFNDAYDALKTYFEITDEGVTFNTSKVPEELTWTIYGQVDYNYTKASYSLTGGIAEILTLVDGDILKQVNLIAGNESAEIVTNPISDSRQTLFLYANRYTKYASDGGVSVPINVLIKGIKFADHFSMGSTIPTNVIIDNCTFMGNNYFSIAGDKTLKNNVFTYNQTYNEDHYAATITDPNGKAFKTYFLNNNVKNYPRGININTIGTTDYVIKGNNFNNITFAERGALQFTRANTLLVENNTLSNIAGNVFIFYYTYNASSTIIRNNTITNSPYLAVFGDDEHALAIPTITSNGNTVNVTNPGKGLTKQGTIQENGFALN